VANLQHEIASRRLVVSDAVAPYSQSEESLELALALGHPAPHTRARLAHTLVWWVSDPKRLSKTASQVIEKAAVGV
jgi:hypothetical protein